MKIFRGLEADFVVFQRQRAPPRSAVISKMWNPHFQIKTSRPVKTFFYAWSKYFFFSILMRKKLPFVYIKKKTLPRLGNRKIKIFVKEAQSNDS